MAGYPCRIIHTPIVTSWQKFDLDTTPPPRSHVPWAEQTLEPMRILDFLSWEREASFCLSQFLKPVVARASWLIYCQLIITLYGPLFPTGRINPLSTFWTYLELFCVHAVSTWNMLSLSKFILSRPSSNFSFFRKPCLLQPKEHLFSVIWSSYCKCSPSVTWSWHLLVSSSYASAPVIGLHCCLFLGWLLNFLRICLISLTYPGGQRPRQGPDTVLYITGTWYLLIWRAGLHGDEQPSIWDSGISVEFWRTWNILTEGGLAARRVSGRQVRSARGAVFLYLFTSETDRSKKRMIEECWISCTLF